MGDIREAFKKQEPDSRVHPEHEAEAETETEVNEEGVYYGETVEVETVN